MRTLIGVSLGIHALIFLHIAGVYRSQALTCIELTIQDVSRPASRDIPRPPHRPRKAPSLEEVKRPTISPRPVPSFRPVQMDPVESDLPDTIAERIAIPEIPTSSRPKIDGWAPAERVDGAGEYASSNAYFEMVRLRIERHKQYPEAARMRLIEGRATIRFVIEADGSASSVTVHRTSGSPQLDRAAIQAVGDASPFPEPPARFFSRPVSLEIMIEFELT
ncbi:MAG: energy transducer TonB [Deltaproteobacteria bacterium]|nr:energy transducer TonB [Deltaproteobacteria bacterium]